MKQIGKLLAVLVLVLAWHSGNARLYTAVNSGQYNTASTWDSSVVPPSALNGDTIFIPWGTTVTLNSDLELTGSVFIDKFIVEGTLNATASALVVRTVSFEGYGVINVDSFSGNFWNRNFLFSGNLNVNKLNGSRLFSGNGATIRVNNALYLADTMSINNGQLIMQNNGRFVMTGGVSARPPYLKIGSSATYSWPAAYDVFYYGSNMQSGVELSSTLRDMTLSMNLPTSTIRLTGNITLNGKLNLHKGILVLAEKHVTFAPGADFEADSGKIRTTMWSDMFIYSNKPQFTTPLKFEAGNDTVGTMILNTNTAVALGTNLNILRELDLVKGKLKTGHNKLTMTSGAVCKGSPAGYVVTDSARGGMVTILTPEVPYTYHLGTDAGYAPCTVTCRATDSSYRGFTARVAEGVKSMADSGSNMAIGQPMVNATWYLSHYRSNILVDMETAWVPALEVNGFDRSLAYLSHFTNFYWQQLQGSAAAPSGSLFSIKREGFKQLGAFAVFDRNTVAVKDVVAQTDIKLFPNPATDVLYITTEKAADAVVYNTTGQAVSRVALQSGRNTLSVAALPPGMYIMQLAGDGVKGTARFIKQ